MSNDPLRRCPVCGGTAARVRGLRDYRWLTLPGRVAPTDIDGLLTHSDSGRLLFLEEKWGKTIRGGQYRTLADLKAKPLVDVWVVDTRKWNAGLCDIAEMEDKGLGEWRTLRIEQLADKVLAWWEAAKSESDSEVPG